MIQSEESGIDEGIDQTITKHNLKNRNIRQKEVILNSDVETKINDEDINYLHLSELQSKTRSS